MPTGPNGEKRSSRPTTSAVQVGRIAVGLDRKDYLDDMTDEERKEYEESRRDFRDRLNRAADMFWND